MLIPASRREQLPVLVSKGVHLAKPLSILCVHGISHGDLDPGLEGSWSKTICGGLAAWNPDHQGAITCDFLKYDNLFEVPDKICWIAKKARCMFISNLLKTNMTLALFAHLIHRKQSEPSPFNSFRK